MTFLGYFWDISILCLCYLDVVSNRATSIVPPGAFEPGCAFQCWLGTVQVAPEGFEATFGVPWQRGDMIDHAQRLLGLIFSDHQIAILQGLSGCCNLVHCFAGAGKTAMMLALALWAMRDTTEPGPARLVWYAAPTKEMVGEFFTALKKAQPSSSSVARAGVIADDDGWGRDLLAEQMEKVADDTIVATGDIQALYAVDKIIKHVHAFYITIRRHAQVSAGPWNTAGDPRDRDHSECLASVVCMCLALRHVHLDQHVYKSMQAARDQVVNHVNQMRVICSTQTFLRKVNGNQANCSRLFKGHRRPILLSDEYHNQSFEEHAASMHPFQCVVSVGDLNQVKHVQRQQQDTIESDLDNKMAGHTPPSALASGSLLGGCSECQRL